MKLNDIRKLAKEIRTGVCEKFYDELVEIYKEIEVYIASPSTSDWTDRTKEIVAEETKQIRDYIDLLAPKDVVFVEAASRKNFKTVVNEMKNEPDPVLAAIRWFAVDYARDEYGSAKCIKGMLERRDFATAKSIDGFDVFSENGNKLVATVILNDNTVKDFKVCA